MTIENSVTNDIIGLGMLRQRDHQSIFANDSGLLASDFTNRVAQIFLVVERDIGNDREQRIDDVGGIEASAHFNFEHGDLRADAGKVLEGYDSEHLEETGMPRKLAGMQQLLCGALDAIVNLAELDIGDGLAVDANALVDTHEMGRAVEGGLVSGGAQDGRQRCCSGAFAVGSGDQDAGETALRVAQRSQHLEHVGEVELVRRCGGELVSEGVKLVNCGLVGHANSSDYNIEEETRCRGRCRVTHSQATQAYGFRVWEIRALTDTALGNIRSPPLVPRLRRRISP